MRFLLINLIIYKSKIDKKWIVLSLNWNSQDLENEIANAKRIQNMTKCS